jgi:hypothetical protein
MTRDAKTIIAVFAACVFAGWAIPHFFRARPTRHYVCVNNLGEIEAAKEEWAQEHNGTNGMDVTWDDLRPYIGRTTGMIPKCPDGGVYRIGKVGEKPTCSIGGVGHTLPDSQMSLQIQHWVPKRTSVAAARQIMEQHQFVCAVGSYDSRAAMPPGSDPFWWKVGSFIGRDGKTMPVTNVTLLSCKFDNTNEIWEATLSAVNGETDGRYLVSSRPVERFEK